MKTWQHKLGPALFALAGVLFMVAAFKPGRTGQSFNVSYLGVGIMFLVLGFVFLVKPGGPTRPSA